MLTVIEKEILNSIYNVCSAHILASRSSSLENWQAYAQKKSEAREFAKSVGMESFFNVQADYAAKSEKLASF